MRDPHRPRREPARTIYDALLVEAEKRDGRSCDEWIMAERMAMWRVSRDYAQQRGLTVATLEDVERAENHGIGHIDYAAKVSYRLSEIIEKR